VAIAETHILLIQYVDAPPDEAWRSVEAAARRALEIDPYSGEAWLVLATMEQLTADDVQGATAMFERAVELAPGYATGRQWYAEYLITIGRIDEAVRQAERAHTLDPQSPIITAILGMAYYYDRRYEEAIRHGRAAREMNPAIPGPHAVLVSAYGKTGRYSEAIEAVAGLMTVVVGPERAAELEAGLTRAWEADGASGYWRQLSAMMEEGDTSPAIAAVPRLRLGDREGALDRIERAVEEGSARWVESSLFNPEFDVLRDDPRFRRLLERLLRG
jgi:tetratricopeptide (TPR) repeat protein